MKNVVDSSAWLEYFADGPNAGYFATAIQAPADLVVPSITLYEVFKKVLRERDEDSALRAVAHMKVGTLEPVDEDLALVAARISVSSKLPIADSLILATARKHQAVVWTQDEHFKNLPRVHYRAKK